eukprot:COSAG01_NODE_16916_length_1194_cov_1.537900_1_plen_95_part_10
MDRDRLAEKSDMAAKMAAVEGENAMLRQVSQNGQLLSRRGRSSPASASGLDTHRDSISSRLSRFDCRHNFNANVSDYMLTSTYWPAWKAAVQEGK